MSAGFFNATAVKFGINVTVYNSDYGSYNIEVMSSSGAVQLVPLSHEPNATTSVKHIRHLEPCTKYTATVSFNNNGSTTGCESENNTVLTGKLGKW